MMEGNKSIDIYYCSSTKLHQLHVFKITACCFQVMPNFIIRENVHVELHDLGSLHCSSLLLEPHQLGVSPHPSLEGKHNLSEFFGVQPTAEPFDLSTTHKNFDYIVFLALTDLIS